MLQMFSDSEHVHNFLASALKSTYLESVAITLWQIKVRPLPLAALPPVIKGSIHLYSNIDHEFKFTIPTQPGTYENGSMARMPTAGLRSIERIRGRERNQ